MKRTISLFIALLFVFGCLPASAAVDNLFIPELVVYGYNEAVGTMFSTLLDGASASAIALAESMAKVEYVTETDGTFVYANDDLTVTFMCTADSKYSSASTMFFYTDMSDKNVLKDLPQLAFGYAISSVDSKCDMKDFLTWINEASDGDTFSKGSFYAAYSETPNESSHILLIMD